MWVMREQGRDVAMGPSQPSFDSSQPPRPSRADPPEVLECRGVAGSWDWDLCSPGPGWALTELGVARLGCREREELA